VDDGLRWTGGFLVAVAAGMVADHLGMPEWQVFTVAGLIGVGLPLAITGKMKWW
jgi:hypothetical protein